MNRSICFYFIGFITSQSLLHAQTCTINLVPSAYSVCEGYQATITAFGANSYTWTGSTFTAPVFGQSVTVGPGTYTVTGDTHTCTASVTIGLQPPLNIQVTQSSPTTCIQSISPSLSKPVTLTASGAGSFTWNSTITPSSQVMVHPAANTCYTVVGETATCSGTAVTCVTLVPQFSIAVSPVTATICTGEAIGLSVSQVGAGAIGPESAFTYSWTGTDTTFSTNSKTVSATPSVSTEYTVAVLDADLCLSTPAVLAITVNVCTDIPKQKIDEATIFPNPFNDYLNINISDAVLIEITDAFGKKVMAIKPGDERKRNVDTSLLLPGFYFVTVTHRELQKSELKLIKH